MSESKPHTPPRARPQRAWWWATVVLLLMIAGGGIWFWIDTHQPTLKPITLSDGTVIQFRGTTFGTNHLYPGTGLGTRLARVLPQRWRYKLMGRNANMSTTKPVLVVWTTVRHPAGWAGFNPRFVLGGDTGFAPVQSSSSINSISPTGESIVGWGFDSFPRRERTIKLRIYEPTPVWPEMKFGGEFAFPNPARRGDPSWAPEPLPSTRTNEAFEVSLRELVAGVSVTELSKPKPLAGDPEAGARAVLRLTKNGQPTDEWAPAGVVMTDPTGNRATSTRWSGQSHNNDFVAGFQPMLWTNEAAWKLRFEFSRKKNFGATETWTAPPLSLAETSLSNNPAFSANLQGASVRIAGIESDSSRNQYNPDKTRQVWLLTIQVNPDREDYRLTLLKAVDDQGQEAETRGISWGGGRHSFDLGVKTNATQLHITVALHQSRYEEFRAKPGKSQ